jgi:zinc transporter ZupT
MHDDSENKEDDAGQEVVGWVTVPARLVGILGGLGAGAMIPAVSLDLLPEAELHTHRWQTGVWMLVGVAVSLIGIVGASYPVPSRRTL